MIEQLVISLLQQYSFVFKKKEFEIENEYRMIVYIPTVKPGDSAVDSVPVERTENRKEYILIDFPKNLLQEVWIDATEEKIAECNASLDERGYKVVTPILREHCQETASIGNQ